MKSFVKIIVVFVSILLLASCADKRKRQVQYMADTDMYNAVPYDTYAADSVFKNGTSAQLPVEGTIARGGTFPYEYENSEAGYQLAKDSLVSPLIVTEAHLENGKKMYDIYCASCHGTKGDGQGPLVQNEKFLGIPNYKDREITQGSIYHVIMHGRNLMGSHSSQLTPTERWQVTHYVEKLRNDLLK